MLLQAIAKRKGKIKGDSDVYTLTLRYRLYEHKIATTIAVIIVGRAITVWEAIQKRSHNIEGCLICAVNKIVYYDVGYYSIVFIRVIIM